MNRILMIFAGLMSLGCCLAQNIRGVDPDNDINTIKRDTSFIYAESTMRDVIEAQSGAETILELKVTDWIRSHYPEAQLDTILAKVSENIQTLISLRGKYNRVLVYVKKGLIVPQPINNVSIDSIQKTDEFIPVLEEDKHLILTAIETQMVSISEFNAIEPFITMLKQERRLNAYGKYASLPEETVCHIFVYDRDGIVVAALRQAEDGTYHNLRTKERDNVRNYKNCGAIWFQLK